LKFQRFFEDKNNDSSASRDIKISIDKIKSNIRWMNSGFKELDRWLKEDQKQLNKSSNLNYRLPEELKPYKYEILFKFQLSTTFENKSFPYDGEVTIFFSCVNDTSSLVFHLNDLIIDNSTLSLQSLTDETFSSLSSFKWYNDYERQFFIGNLSVSFKSGNSYKLSTKFTGFLKDDNKGFYRSSYIDDNNTTKWLMTSQLESTDARKAFPCFVRNIFC
jgi:aminopeptidase N